MPVDHRKRVVVIGAGILGASIAFNLAERGAKVTILDAGAPGQGTSAVSFAWINSHNKDPHHYHDFNRRSLDMWDRFSRRLGGRVGLTWGGELRWAASPLGAARLIGRLQTLQGWGYPARQILPDELRALEPGLALGPVSAASYSPLEGHVDTGLVIRACLSRAEVLGAVIRAQTNVTALHKNRSGSIEMVEVEHGTVACETVVMAGGPDMPALAALAGVNLPLYHTFGATVITEPLPPLLKTAAVIHTPHEVPPQIALRQLPDGSVMIHGGDHDGSLGQTNKQVEQVVRAAGSWFPALEGVSLKEVRRGRRPIPQDGLPIIGFCQTVPNLYLATMHSGVTLAPLVGELATIEIMDQITVELLAPYRIERFG